MTVVILQKAFSIPENTGTGNFDFTTLDLNGLTPKGVIVQIIRTGLDTSKGSIPGYGINWGAYDGTNQTALHCSAKDGNEPGLSPAIAMTSSVHTVRTRAEGNNGNMSATGSALIENGVRLNLLDTDANSQFIFTITFFAGTDVSFECGTHQYDTSVIATSFTPEAVIFSSVAIKANTIVTGSGGRFSPSHGFACQRPTGLAQAGYLGAVDVSDPTPGQTPRVLVNGVCGSLSGSTQTIDATIAVSALNSNGVVIIPDLGGPDGGLEVMSFAVISTGGVKTWDLQTMLLDQTESVSFEQTGVGFKPDGIFLMPSGHTSAVNTVETDDTGWGMMFSDGGNEGGHIWGAGPESAGNDDVVGKHRMPSEAIATFTVTAGSTSLVSQAFVSEMGADGFTLAITGNSGVSESHKIPFMTFGEEDTSVVVNDGRIAFATGSANTSTGNQSFTAPLGGAIPKGAWLMWTRATDDSSLQEAVTGYGFVDQEGRQFTAAMRVVDNSSITAPGFSTEQTGRCIDMLAPSTDTSEGVAEFVSFIANGITVNWTTAPPVGWAINIVLFSGSDVETGVRNIRIETGKKQDQTNVGFDPDFAILAGSLNDIGEETADGNPAISIGFLTNEAVPQTLFSGWRYDVNSSLTRSFYLADSSLAWDQLLASGVTSGGWTQLFKAEGIQIALTGPSTLAQNLIVFCVKMPGASYNAQAFSVTAGTGAQSFTGVGFQPTHLISFLGNSNADGTIRIASTPCESHGIGFFDGLSRQRSLGIRSNYFVATTDTGSFSSDDRWSKMIAGGPADATNEIEVTSVDSDGFTIEKIEMAIGAVVVPTISFGVPVPNTANKVKGNWL